MSVWDDVAAPGTDPGLLSRLVARRYLPRSSATVLLRRVSAAVGDGASPAAALAEVAGNPPAAARMAAREAAATWHERLVTVSLPLDPGYPSSLAAGWPATGAPLWLATRGDGDVLRGPCVAIVGARRASGYGTGVAAWLAEAAAAAGATVVSGGAVGIDAAAHEAALGLRGGTAVVLGCGHDVAYPRGHAAPGGLFDRIAADGGALVSEHLPEATPRPFRVRTRNRIVAGLAQAVVVVEGGARSGSLLTASAAADLGVTVLAVPGDVRAPGSAAPHRLLAEGAAPCTEPADLLAVLGTRTPSETAAMSESSLLPPAVRTVLQQRWPRPIPVGDLAAAADVPVGRLLARLTRARMAGEVAEGADGVRLRRAPSPEP